MSYRLTSLYTPLAQAVAELRLRHHDAPPQPVSPFGPLLSSRQFAVLFRQLVTPNFELQRFVAVATAHGLAPLVCEFHRDKFVSCNPLKYGLARLRFCDGVGRNGGPRTTALTIADMTAADGCPLGEVQTLWGQSLVAFHHDLLGAAFPPSTVTTLDISDWLCTHGSAPGYYTSFLSVFAERAILFDTFLLTSHEEQFTSEVVIPAFHAASSRHGRRPLICRLDPTDSEGHAHWLQYPHALREFVADRLSSTSTPLRNEPNG